ncbi:hypothetical protein K474DRAFT_1188688 [Panus rudis PR-1116 ss-1]|nr:hypothetical protein K474DRAFT_1188688 [Panus rudis PR-1116 ss-1]
MIVGHLRRDLKRYSRRTWTKSPLCVIYGTVLYRRTRSRGHINICVDLDPHLHTAILSSSQVLLSSSDAFSGDLSNSLKLTPLKATLCDQVSSRLTRGVGINLDYQEPGPKPCQSPNQRQAPVAGPLIQAYMLLCCSYTSVWCNCPSFRTWWIMHDGAH